MPFWGEEDTVDPDAIELAQVGPNRFELKRGFRYKARDQTTPYAVPADGTSTDLASVKWPFLWLVASHGMHTKAALLHDVLIDPTPTYPTPVARRRADELFFWSLKESNIGPAAKRKRPSFVRRWLMYSAAAIFGTMRKEAPARLALFAVNLVVFWALAVSERGWAMLAVGLVGFLWPLVLFTHVSYRLAFGLWPSALLASVLVLPVAAAAVVAAFAIFLIDLGYNVLWSVPELSRAAVSRDGSGVKDALRGTVPVVWPYREPGQFS